MAEEQFTTLSAALQAADLEGALRGPGVLTLFAPTNEAFEALPPGTLDELLEDIPALSNILLYHAAEGNFTSTDLVDLNSVTSLQGQLLTITESNGEIMVNDARVIDPDVMAANGVIHAIDAVLIPPESTPAPTLTPTPTHTPTPTPTPTLTPMPTPVVIELIAQNNSFNLDTITVPAGSEVNIEFNNMDEHFHNFAVYDSPDLVEEIFLGDYVDGPDTTTYTFTAPETPGTYFFRCEIFPTVMNGDFIVE